MKRRTTISIAVVVDDLLSRAAEQVRWRSLEQAEALYAAARWFAAKVDDRVFDFWPIDWVEQMQLAEGAS